MFSSPDPKGHMSFCPHISSIVRQHFCILDFMRTAEWIRHKQGTNVAFMVLTRYCYLVANPSSNISFRRAKFNIGSYEKFFSIE